MGKWSNFCICALVVFVTIYQITGSGNDLNIGVLSPWKDVVADANRNIPHRNGSRYVWLNIESDMNMYDRIVTYKQKLEEFEVHALVGPFDHAFAFTTEKLKIPYMATTLVDRVQPKYIFRMLPQLEYVCNVMSQIVKEMRWTKVSVFFDDDTGIAVVDKLMSNQDLNLKTWRIPSGASEKAIRDNLLQMRKIKIQKVICLCGRNNIEMLLNQARNLAMVSNPYEWLFYDPAISLASIIKPYHDININFTIVSIVPYGEINSNKSDALNVTVAMDTLHVLRAAQQNLDFKNANVTREMLYNNLKRIEDSGITGSIVFDDQGRRSNITMILTGIIGYEIRQFAYWNSDTGNLFFLGNRTHMPNRTASFPLKGRTTRIVTILEEPFTMLKRDAKNRKGNDQFEGYVIDLIRHVAEMLEFDYELYLVPDGKFGSRDDHGNWNGMLGELLSGNASMSVAPLSINSMREEAVDFTKPFMTRHINVLIKVPQPETSYFEFLNPLSPNVWMCTFGAFVVISIVLYVLERIGATKERDYKHISFKECFWFIFGSLLMEGTDVSPCTIPGRVITSAWWFFTLILISSYTANLAAFLTVRKINTPINSVTDLAQQTKIRYGTVQDSDVMSFFKNSKIEHFQKMWAQMSEIDPSSLVKNTTVGLQKVKEEAYAFFWDTTVTSYKTLTDCQLMTIGPNFDPKGFGIGVPPGATYRDDLSMEILRLSDRGTLHKLQNTWWGQTSCSSISAPSTKETSELEIDNVAGVFFILVGGIVLACIVAGIDYCVRRFFKSIKEKKKTKKAKENEFHIT